MLPRTCRQLSNYIRKSFSSRNMSSNPILDKAVFNVKLPLVSIKIRKEACTTYQKTLKGHLFDRPRMKRIYDVPEDPDFRYILLSEAIQVNALLLPVHLKQFIEDDGGVLGQYELNLGYKDLSVDEVLTRLLPDGCEVPSSFEQVGHLAHMNLRDDILPYKNIIGQVILDKNPKLRTVVNKIGNIETEFRTFPMELLAGDADFEVAVKESGSTFRFNFKDVYWNSRLGTEHNRIITSIIQAEARATSEEKFDSSPGSASVKRKSSADEAKNKHIAKRAKTQKTRGVVTQANTLQGQQLPVIADMMGGVGPFSIPLGKSRLCEVHCNDLNPASFACMVQNAKANHCSSPFLSCYNMCGREFILELLQRGNSSTGNDCRQRIDHVLMNLPQSATDFLDVFIGYNSKQNEYNGRSGATDHDRCAAENSGRSTARVHLPIIHVYAFSKCVETPHSAIADIAERSAGVLQCPVSLLGVQHLAASNTGIGGIASSSSSSLRAGSNHNFISQMIEQHSSAPHAPICFGHIVRNVSPKKVMVCLSFRLPKYVAEMRGDREEEAEENNTC